MKRFMTAFLAAGITVSSMTAVFAEQYGVETPFYVFFIAAADKGQFGVTAIYTNQATGRIMEPVLVKGAEGLR